MKKWVCDAVHYDVLFIFSAHKTGRAGGGWESDDEVQDSSSSPITSDFDVSLGLADQQPSEEQVVGVMEEQFLNTLLNRKTLWPVDHDKLIELCQECTSLDISLLLRKISDKIILLNSDKTHLKESEYEKSQEHNEMPSNTITLEKSLSAEDTQSKFFELPTCTMNFLTRRLLVLLVLVEFGFYYDVFPPALITGCIGKTLQILQENQNLESMVRVKAKKLSLITCKFI